MQDIHSIAGGRIFGGGGSGGDRRLRPHLHHHPNNQALKCPRCDSTNTKFCYYNNYNLSQPRHFCKGCRRYWTKGGVLRNVPVGGGCRKTKRSKSKSSQAPDSAAATAAVQPQRERKSSSNSSSESSSLTATTTGATTATATTANTTTTATTTAATEAVSGTSSISPSGFLNIPEYKSMMSQSMNHNTGFEHELLEQSTDCGLFSEIGNLTSLITSSNDQLPFGFSSVLDPQNQWHQPHKFGGAMCTEQEMKLQQPGPQEIPGSDRPFLDQNVHVDLATPVQSRSSSNGIFGMLDWQPNGDQGFFDLPNAVDQAYWSQTTQWNDVDHPSNLYLP